MMMIIMRNLIKVMMDLMMLMMMLKMLIKKATLTGLLRRTQQVRGTARPVVGDH